MMKTFEKYLIIPDVHGRTFWKEPVEAALADDKTAIIFLGDYLDPYKDEWDGTERYKTFAINIFKEILEIKRNKPQKVVLLLGNHDLGYALSHSICNCRTDYENHDEIIKLFDENKDLFQLAYKATINGKDFVFSHAGLSLEGLNDYGFNFTKENIVDNVNDYLHKAFGSENMSNDTIKFIHYLGACSRFRGGYDRYSSLVWADLYEFVVCNFENIGYQIFGHTRCLLPTVTDKFAMLDCSKAFYLNAEGKLTDLNGKELEMKKGL